MSDYKNDTGPNPNKDYKTNGPMNSLGYAAGLVGGFMLGGPVGAAVGAAVGGAVGSSVGYYTGSGDYELQFPQKKQKMFNKTSLAKFKSGQRTNIVCNREYIGDITTSGTIGAFKNEQFVINPGLGRTFPWLSTMAQQYEQYKVHGMVFEFKSTSGDSVASTNTAIGTVILSTEYNVNASPYINKQYMENAQYAQSAKSSVNQLHGIECSNSDRPMQVLFTRTGNLTASGDSLKWYDLANFQIATVGFQAANVVVGELWVSYNIEFFKPQIPKQIGGAIAGMFLGLSNANTPSFPFGDTPLFSRTTFEVAVLGTSITVPVLPLGSRFSFIVNWTGTSVLQTNLAFTYSGFTPINLPNGAGVINVPTNGETSQRKMHQQNLFVTSNPCVITYASGVIPTASACQLQLLAIDNSFYDL